MAGRNAIPGADPGGFDRFPESRSPCPGREDRQIESRSPPSRRSPWLCKIPGPEPRRSRRLPGAGCRRTDGQRSSRVPSQAGPGPRPAARQNALLLCLRLCRQRDEIVALDPVACPAAPVAADPGAGQIELRLRRRHVRRHRVVPGPTARAVPASRHLAPVRTRGLDPVEHKHIPAFLEPTRGGQRVSLRQDHGRIPSDRGLGSKREEGKAHCNGAISQA